MAPAGERAALTSVVPQLVSGTYVPRAAYESRLRYGSDLAHLRGGAAGTGRRPDQLSADVGQQPDRARQCA